MEIKEYLKKIGVKFKTFNHPAVYTVEEAKKYNQNINGMHSKNLFLKERKAKRYYLFILPAEKKFEIATAEQLTKDKLKFANEKEINDFLGSYSGAVSPFGLINDKENKISLLIDKEVWNSDFVSFHPNINTETLELSKGDFQKYIHSLKNKLELI